MEPVGDPERLRPACRIDLALQVLPRRPSLDGPPSVSSRPGSDDAQVIDRRKHVQDACQPVELARVENGLEDHVASYEGHALSAVERLQRVDTPRLKHRSRRREGDRRCFHRC